MKTKLFEIRDRGTLIPAIGTLMSGETPAENFLIARAGYGPDYPLVLLTRLEGDAPAQCDPFKWSGSRTFHVAHGYIQSHWDSLTSGDVICVETVLGERTTPKTSERYDS